MNIKCFPNDERSSTLLPNNPPPEKKGLNDVLVFAKRKKMVIPGP